MMKTTILILSIVLFSKMIFAQSAPFANFTPSVNSYIDYGRGLNIDCLKDISDGNKLTISLWVKWTNKTDPGVGNWANLFTLADSTNSGDNGVFWVQHNSDNSKFEFALHTNARSFVYSTTTPVSGTWYFLTLAYDGSLANNNMKFYVNGVQEASANKTGNIRNFPTASRLNMGRWPNPSNNYRHFNGKLDEVSIWKKALTPAQILGLMNTPTIVTGINYDAIGLIGFWNFDNLTANNLGPCIINGLIGSSTSLPVTFTSLIAISEAGKVNVNWSTALEINNDYFLVQKSNNGVDYIDAGKIKGSGNSNVTNSYKFTDYNPYSGSSYYRLRQVDFDGKESYSSITAVNVNADFSLSMFPNPSNGNNVIVKLNSDETTNFEIIVTDISGREVYSSVNNNGSVTIPTSEFQKGIFFVKAVSGENISLNKIINN